MSWWMKMNWPLNLKHISDAERQTLTPKDWDTYCGWDQHKIVKYSNWKRKEVVDRDAYYSLFHETWESWDFATNGWNVVNDTTNKWEVWQADKYMWDYSCYISTDWWATAWYDPNTANVSHIYKDFTIPTTDDMALKAFWKTVWESWYDRMDVFIAPTSVTPAAWNEVSQTYAIGGFNGNGAWNESTISTWDAHSWDTIRLIISWRNDWSVWTNPWWLFDELYILYK